MYFSHLDHCINHGTGICTFGRITEQPVPSSNCKGTDCIFTEIVRKTAPSILQVSHKLIFVILGIVHRLLKTGSFLRSLLWNPFPECFQYRLFFFKPVCVTLLRSMVFGCRISLMFKQPVDILNSLCSRITVIQFLSLRDSFYKVSAADVRSSSTAWCRAGCYTPDSSLFP